MDIQTLITDYADILKVLFLIAFALLVALSWYINSPTRHKNLGFTKDTDSLQRQLDRVTLEIMNTKQ